MQPEWSPRLNYQALGDSDDAEAPQPEVVEAMKKQVSEEASVEAVESLLDFVLAHNFLRGLLEYVTIAHTDTPAACA